MAQGWGSPRIQAVLSDLYHKGLLGVLASGNRDAIGAFLRAELGEEFSLPT